MKKLNFELKELVRQNPVGSKATQQARKYTLNQAANDLNDLGFKSLSKSSLKPKHVHGLLEKWRVDGVSDATLKNRLTHLRWWAAQVNKAGLIPKKNEDIGVGKRTLVSNVSKAKTLGENFNYVEDESIRLSLQLQQAFGLRREEAIKFNASYADQVDKLTLKPSWTKGGRARQIPIRTEAQRALVDRVHKFAGKAALIPEQKTYYQQLKTYENLTAKAGMDKLHGLRHHYAQNRYQEITGWASPLAGGPKKKTLSSDDKALDNTARQIISRELGHERLEIVSVYIGS